MVMSVVIRDPKPSTVVNVVTSTGRLVCVTISRTAATLSRPASRRWWYSVSMWTSSAKPMVISRDGMMAVMTLIGMPRRAIAPSAHTTLRRPVTIGITTPWRVLRARNRMANRTTSEIGISPTRSRRVYSPNRTLVSGVPI